MAKQSREERLAKRRAYEKAYLEANKEKRRAYEKAYREANREAMLTKAREVYKETKDIVQEKRRRVYNSNKVKLMAEIKRRRIMNKLKPSQRYTNIKNSAKNRGIEVKFTVEEFTKWVESRPLTCEYCGDSLNNIGPKAGAIDRIESSRPYAIDNIVNCCMRCNQAKNNLSQTEFKEHITKIYENFKRKASEVK